MTLLDKEPVKRVDQLLKNFDEKQNVIVLNSSARTAEEAASSLGCEVGAIVKSLLFKTENKNHYISIFFLHPPIFWLLFEKKELF